MVAGLDKTEDAREDDELRSAVWPSFRPEPSRQLRCRHCGQHNRVCVPAAVVGLARHRCGRCEQGLFLDREAALSGILPEAYQHPSDRRFVHALRSIPGLSVAMRRLLRSVGDRSMQIMFMADAIRCSEQQFPELLRLVERACFRLDLAQRPRVYLSESPQMNAMTTGVGRPLLIVRSALLDQMNDAELLAVIGHELGHLHADHPLFGSLAQTLVSGSSLVSASVRALGWPVQRLLLGWLRTAELTADRAALLVSRDLRACLGMMLTFAGGNRPGTSRRTRMALGPFVEQCRTLARLQLRNPFDGFLGRSLVLDRTHPHLAARAVHLIQWVEHGSYLDILAGNYPRESCERPSI
jgi:Zn-dependent protease with chaperone function